MRAVAEFFKVLADESRLQMLWLLHNHRELCVCDFVEALKITQSKASRHLLTLKHAGLVVDRRVGAWSYYSLCPLSNSFERTQLAALVGGMPAHPSAVEVLASLEEWLNNSKRGGTCSSDGRIGCKSGQSTEKDSD